jgi:hypothetical protein
MVDDLRKRRDGTYEETFGDGWRAEYSEAPDTGLWVAAIYRRDAGEWQSPGHASLDEARLAAREHYDASA